MACVFISHSSRDRGSIEREIIPLLKQNGLETWYSTTDIRTDVEFERQIVGGLEACDWFLVVMSPNAVASDWVRREVSWAVDERKGRIIPVMLKTCKPAKLHLALHGLNYIDFRQDTGRAKKQLLAQLGLDAVTEPPRPRPRPWVWALAAALLVSALSLLWYFSTKPQTDSPDSVNAAVTTNSPRPEGGAAPTPSAAPGRRANQNGAPSVTITPLDRRIQMSNTAGGNK